MRGKKAKALRRLARSMTVGAPYREYDKTNVRRYKNDRGMAFETGTIMLAEGCTRAVYKQLKRIS